VFEHKSSTSYDTWVEHLFRAENKDLLREHSWITGGSDSGKTAILLAPLALELIRRGDVSVVRFDQKEDGLP
jgi:hypothetical protein